MSERKPAFTGKGGKAGQARSAPRRARWTATPTALPAVWRRPQGHQPEEILGAAHAACFTMAFSFAAEKAGVATESVDTTASVRLSKDGDGFVIDRIALTLKAKVPGLDDAAFQNWRPMPRPIALVESAGRGARDHAGSSWCPERARPQRLQAKQPPAPV